MKKLAASINVWLKVGTVGDQSWKFEEEWGVWYINLIRLQGSVEVVEGVGK